MRQRTKAYATGLIVALVSMMTACSGGGSSATGSTGTNVSGSGTGGTSGTTIEGIATPSSVSVVTATNQ